MEQFARRILAFCTACLMAAGVLAVPLQGNAATWEGGGEASTPYWGDSPLEDLRRRLENREPDITLTDHVEVGASIALTTYGAPVTVHMGSYGIRVLEGVNLHLSGPITFVGEGDTAPLFQLEQDASMIDYMGGASITATGDDAVALSMEPGVYLFCPELEIRATGSGSTALEIRGDTRLDRLHITANRQDSVAISANGDLCLDTCTVSGEIDVAGDLTLDLSSVNPLPEDARIIRRQALWLLGNGIDLNLFGCSSLAGSPDPLPDAISMEFVDADGVGELRRLGEVPIRWDIGEQDLSLPGTYTVHGTPQIDPLPGLEGADRTAIEVHIVEPGRPWLTGISIPNALYVRLHLLEKIGDAEELRLYHSSDGESWTMLDRGEAELYDWDRDIFDLVWKQDHYMQLEVVGGAFAGHSNILFFYLDENGVPGDGGTRDGTAQEGGEDPSPYPAEEDGAGAGNRGTGRTGGDGRLSTGSSRPDAGTTTPVFEGAGPPTEETPPPQQPAAKIPAVTLTAPQLSTLLEVNPQQLTFHEDGMTVILPSELLAALALGEASLSVSMGMTGTDGFHLSIISGDREIPSLDGQAFPLWVPYATRPEALEHIYVLDGDGSALYAADYMDGRLLFHLVHTGSYTILDKRDIPEAGWKAVAARQLPPSQEEALPAQEEPVDDEHSPILPVVFALLVTLTAGASILLRSRGGKGHADKTPD